MSAQGKRRYRRRRQEENIFKTKHEIEIKKICFGSVNMADCEKKTLSDLRVVDLKSELEKRSLETTGVKTFLIERLSQVSRRKI